MANTIVPWVYTADNGRDYVIGVNSEITTQLHGGDPDGPKIGGATAVGATTDGPLPSSVKPRRVYLKNPAGNGRYLTVMEPDAWLLTTGRTINIEDSDGASTTYTVRRVHGENFGRSRV